MLGFQLHLDLYDCSLERLDDITALESAVQLVVQHMNADVLQIIHHRFQPQGITCIAIISASHIALHTWPEHCFLTVDVFSCAGQPDLDQITAALQQHFAAGHVRSYLSGRGEDIPSSK